MLAERSGRASFPDTGALYPSRARPPYRTETADDLDDRPACRANPTGLVPRSIHRLEGLAAIRICCASRGNCCRRVIPKDAAILVADRAGYPRSWRGAENNNLSVPVNGRPAPNGLEEPGGREDERAFEVSPADAETRYSAPQAAARPPLRGPRRTVTGQVVPLNPAGSVRGPRHVVTSGHTPVLDPAEARALLDSIDTSTPTGLRDRALIGLMVYSFARIGAALGMRVEDVHTQNRRLWVRLHEKGGKRHEMPCHRTLEAHLHEYLEGTGIAGGPKGSLFRTIGCGTGRLSRTPLPQANAYALVQRRAAAAGIGTQIGCHTFRATGITAYLRNGGTLESAAIMANHASTRTTQFYDRRRDEISLDEVERIRV